MLEGLVFPVYVGQEMFRAFGQVQNGLQVDDFRACGTDVGDALGEQFQKSHVVPNLFRRSISESWYLYFVCSLRQNYANLLFLTMFAGGFS